MVVISHFRQIMAFFLYANIGSEYKLHTFYESEESRDLIGGMWMKEKLYKLFITLMVCLSLRSGPVVQNEIVKILEALSGTGKAQILVIDEEEKESEEIKKKNKLP